MGIRRQENQDDESREGKDARYSQPEREFCFTACAAWETRARDAVCQRASRCVCVSVCVSASRDASTDDEGSVVDGKGIDSRMIGDPATEDTSDGVRDPDHRQQVGRLGLRDS